MQKSALDFVKKKGPIRQKFIFFLKYLKARNSFQNNELIWKKGILLKENLS